MGERSQIYIKLNVIDRFNKEHTHLMALYYSWNYNERMISRVRNIAEWLSDGQWWLQRESFSKLETIARTNFDMKDALNVCDIVRESIEYNDYRIDGNLNNSIFNDQDNNHGQAFIEATATYNKGVTVSYCFRSHEGLNGCKPLNVEDYLLNDNIYRLSDMEREYVEHKIYMKLTKDTQTMLYQNLNRLLGIKTLEDCEILPPLIDNIGYLNEKVGLMNERQLQNFLEGDYSNQFRDVRYKEVFENLSRFRTEKEFEPSPKGSGRADFVDSQIKLYEELMKGIKDGTIDTHIRQETEEEIER